MSTMYFSLSNLLEQKLCPFFFKTFFVCGCFCCCCQELYKITIIITRIYLFASDSKMCTGICLGDVPFITVL